MRRTVVSMRFQSSVSGGSRSRVPRTACKVLISTEVSDYLPEYRRVPLRSTRAVFLTGDELPAFPLFEISRRVVHVIAGVLQDCLAVIGVEAASLPGRNTRPKRIGGYNRVLWNHSSRSNNGALANSGVVENRRPHADEACIFNYAPVNGRIVSDRDPVANLDRMLIAHAVQYGAILNITVSAHADGMHVAPQNRI